MADRLYHAPPYERVVYLDRNVIVRADCPHVGLQDQTAAIGALPGPPEAASGDSIAAAGGGGRWCDLFRQFTIFGVTNGPFHSIYDHCGRDGANYVWGFLENFHFVCKVLANSAYL